MLAELVTGPDNARVCDDIALECPEEIKDEKLAAAEGLEEGAS